MQHGAGLGTAFPAADMLAFHPPAPDFLRVARIPDIDDLQYIARIALREPCRVEVTPAVIVVAVGAVAAGLPVAKKLRGFWVTQVPDQRALAPRLAFDMAPSWHDLFLGGN